MGADLAFKVIRSEYPGFQSFDHLSGLRQQRWQVIAEDLGPRDDGIVHLPFRGDGGTDDIEMLPRFQPRALQDRRGGIGHGADDVGALHPRLHINAMRDGQPGMPVGGMGGEGLRGLDPAADDMQMGDRTDRHHRCQMVFGLFAGADQRQARGVGSGQRPRRHGRGGGGADRGQQPRIHHRHGAARLGLEQHHGAAMAGQAFLRVFGKEAHQLHAVALRLAQGAGHDAHHVRAAHRHHMAQGQFRRPARDAAHRGVDDLDRLVHRQQRGDIGVGEDPHA